MADRKYEVTHREALFQGYFRVDRFHVRHERFAGDWTPVFTREVFERGRAAGVLLFDPHQDKVVMVEQFRAGVMAKDEYPWLMELVAGIIEPGESRESTALRECVEEAACVVTELQPILSYYASPGCMAEYTSLYVGRTVAPKQGGLQGVQRENEDIRVHVMDAAQAISLLYANKLRDAASIIAMQWFAMHHTELRSRWLMSDTSTPLI